MMKDRACRFKLTISSCAWYIFFMGKVAFIGALMVFFSSVTASSADIFKYTDDSGITYYTNAPESKDYKKVMSEKKPSRTYQSRDEFDWIIDSMSSKYDIEPSLIKAIISVESNWNNNAVSNKGAMGLMQLMPSTARDMDVSDPFNPTDNIEGGTRYLRYLLDRFSELPLALAAYNAGPKKVESSRGIPSITETEQYVKKVLALYNGPASISRAPRIYKVTLEDGTVLFTNTPFAYQNFKVSNF